MMDFFYQNSEQLKIKNFFYKKISIKNVWQSFKQASGTYRNSHPEVLWREIVLKTFVKHTFLQIFRTQLF